jgi:hypothetical protein
MMGSLARLLAGKQIDTPAENYWADVQGDIEDQPSVIYIINIYIFMSIHIRL